MTTSEEEVLQSKIRKLLWLCNQTCADIRFQISNLASNLNRATVNELIQCNKIISKLKDTNLQFQFKRLQENLNLAVYSDASFVNLTDGASQGA